MAERESSAEIASAYVTNARNPVAVSEVHYGRYVHLTGSGPTDTGHALITHEGV
jgi:hypothetical protein